MRFRFLSCVPKTHKPVLRSVFVMFVDWSSRTHSFSETDETVEISEAAAENGQILAVQRHDPNSSHVILHTRGTLAGVHLVCDRRYRKRHTWKRLGSR